MSEITLTEVVLRQRTGPDVACPCQNYTGLTMCCCEPEPDPVEEMAKTIYGEQKRVLAWDDPGLSENFKDIIRRQARGRLSGVAR